MRAVAIPTEAIGVYNQALSMASQGNYTSALTEYQRAINIYPQFIEAYNNIGEIYSQLGNPALAISSYMSALDIDRNYRVLLNLGVEFYNEGRYMQALPYFKESIVLNPDFLEGNFYVGMVYFNLKNYQDAEYYFTRVVQFDMKHHKANYFLSYIYYEWKQYAKVISCLDMIQDVSEDKMFINKYYGFCYYYLGDNKKAVEFLSKALENSPRYEVFREYLKTLTVENKLKEIGDLDKRIKEMESLLITGTLEVKDYTHLSMLYIFKGEYRKAEDLLTSASIR